MGDLTDVEFDELAAMLDKPYEEYWYELGRFIHVFSGVEGILQSLVHHFSGLEDKLGKAIAYGLRVENAKDMINRILDATDRQEIKLRLARPFAQLGVISNVRNNIIHYGAHDTSSGLLISTDRIAFTEEKAAYHPVSAEALRLMRHDLNLIHSLLMFERWEGAEKSPLSPELVQKVRARTWLYKRPQPILRKRKAAKV